MCGIAGFIGHGTLDDLTKMQNNLSHRGPDDRGVLHIHNVGLAHTRLSILDTSERGKQPMSHQHLHITFNGEIYNFRNIKLELETKGHTFTTQTDTEVILHAYQEYGVHCITQFNGMFAFALYDEHKQTLLIARDRTGQKPLYWSVQNNTLVFASELHALTTHPHITADIDPQAMSAYLMHEYIPNPHSIFKKIYKLPPATYAIYKNNTLTQHKYWQPEQPTQYISKIDAYTQLDRLLSKSVQHRLISDVPLGIFLSGGLDSSTIAYYAQKQSTKQIKTFSIGFDEKSFDESSDARIIAKHLNTDHYEFSCTQKNSLDLIEKIPKFLDEPIADPSIIPTLLLSQYTKQHVTVALGGDGADELFAGYPTFVADKWYTPYAHIPSWIHKKIITPLVHKLPAPDTYFSTSFKLKKFISAHNYPYEWRHDIWLSAFHPQMQKQLLKQPHIFTPHTSTTQNLNQTLIHYQKTYMSDDILTKVDRASMRYGLEVRAPFLDHTIIEFTNTLPPSFKCNHGTRKYILKQLMRDKLPPHTLRKKKQGFAIPVAGWLNNELQELLCETLSPRNIKNTNIFNSKYIQQLITEHRSHKTNHRKPLWTLLIFMLWYNQLNK